MELLLIVLVILLLFGGGGYYGQQRGYYGWGGNTFVWVIGLALLIFIFARGSAYPADSTVVTTVPVLPLYQFLEPYIEIVFSTVFAAILAWGVAEFRKRTGVQISANAQANLQQAASNAAGRIIASQEGNVANMKIDVHSALVAEEIPKVMEKAADSIKTLGITPEKTGQVVADLIAAKVGLQQTPVAPPVVVAPVTTTAGSL